MISGQSAFRGELFGFRPKLSDSPPTIWLGSAMRRTARNSRRRELLLTDPRHAIAAHCLVFK
jgi:hypothetical protein